MPNDNQAKSYIAAVLARADGATPGPWEASFVCCAMGMGHTSYAHQVRIGGHDYTVAHSEVVTGDVEHTGRSQTLVNPTNAKPTLEPDAAFIAHARQDIPTLAKIALRAIAALEYESVYTNDMYAVGRIDDALADINALATKGSQ